MNNTHFFESYNYQIPLKPYKYWISLLSQSFYVVAVETTVAVAVITTAATTAVGSSSFFCFCAEMDAAATIAADLLKRQRLFPLPFLLPFFCFLLFLFFLFQTFQIYLIKRISINDKFLFFFRFHNHIPLKNFFYI